MPEVEPYLSRIEAIFENRAFCRTRTKFRAEIKEILVELSDHSAASRDKDLEMLQQSHDALERRLAELEEKFQ